MDTIELGNNESLVYGVFPNQVRITVKEIGE